MNDFEFELMRQFILNPNTTLTVELVDKFTNNIFKANATKTLDFKELKILRYKLHHKILLSGLLDSNYSNLLKDLYE